MRHLFYMLTLGLLCGWLGLPPAAAETPAAPLPVIVSASEYDYPPYCLINADGDPDGFSVELLKATLAAMDREVSFRLGPWDEVKRSLEEGRVQVLPLVGRTPEREEVFDFTFPYLTMHGTIVVRKDQTDIRTLDDLVGRQVAVMRGDNAEELLRRIALDARIVTTETFEQALWELSQGKHDAVILQKLVALQLMQQLQVDNLTTVGPPLQEFVQSFCFAVREGDKELLGLLNEGLSLVIADGTFRRLHSKWFGPIEASQSRQKRIVVGGDRDYPPYEYLDANGEPAGYNVELTRAVARQLGLEVAFRLGTWEETRRALARGEIDLIQGMFYSPEREADYAFSPAHTVVNHAIVVREGTKMPGSLAELGDKSILVMSGDILHEVALSLGYGAKLLPVATQEDALRLLAAGQGDCALTAKVPALYWIEKRGWDNLRVSDHSIRSPEYCYAASKPNQALIALFSEGLANVQATGEYRQIYSRWLGVYERSEPHFVEFIQRFLWLVILIAGLLLASLVWSYTLRRTVRRRTVELRREISERKRREAEIRAKNAELDEKNAELERFTYTVSHDLKSPLVTLKTFLGYLERDLQSGSQENVTKDLNFMHNAADRMTQLLTDLLELSRVGMGAAPAEPLGWRELLYETLATMAGAISEQGARVNLPSQSLTLYGERTRLMEIWQNLVDNAIKYRQPNMPPVIDIGVDMTDAGPVFYVADNGQGIEPRYHEKIFGLFNQLDPQQAGSGLGLALVKRIVEIYKGRIWVESAGAGQGSRFRFTLPAALKTDEGAEQ